MANEVINNLAGKLAEQAGADAQRRQLSVEWWNALSATSAKAERLHGLLGRIYFDAFRQGNIKTTVYERNGNLANLWEDFK